MYAQNIFDNRSRESRLHTGWGLSFLIDDRILFDTGESGVELIENMNALGTDIAKIKIVVISHDHWDHQGGLSELLKLKEGLIVYGCSDMPEQWQEKIERSGNRFEVATRMKEIANGIFLTGDVIGEYKGEEILEQAVATRTDKGMSIFTGCAHPGILKISEMVKKHFKGNFYAVLGGMHMNKEELTVVNMTADILKKEMGFKKAGPTHCSGEEARCVFRQTFGQDFLDLQVGTVIEV